MKKLLAYLAVIVNAFLFAVVFHLFVYPNNFAPAGVGGIATMLQYLLHINAGYTNLLINLPLALVTYFCVSKSHAFRGLFFTFFSSAFLVLLSYVDLTPFLYHTENGTSTIIGPLVSSVLIGFLMASAIRIGGNHGGTFFLSLLIHKRHPQMNTFWVNFAINTTVAVSSYFVYGRQIEPVLLCILYNFITFTVSDMVIKHDRSAVRFEIVSDNPQQLRELILNQFHHSATLLPGKGLFQGKETDVMICVVNHSQAPLFAAAVRSLPNTFASMCSVTEVFGKFLHFDSHGKLEKHIMDLGDKNVV